MMDAMASTPPLTGAFVDQGAALSGPGLFNILRRRRDERPREPGSARVEIHRQPLSTALDWHQEVIALWKRHPQFGPALHDELDRRGLLSKCVILTARDGGPLCFRYIGEPTRRVFGERWAAENIGKPHLEDIHSDFARAIDAQYREAIEGGEPVYNRLLITGLPRPPVNYVHLLFGWSLGDRRQALLALIDT